MNMRNWRENVNGWPVALSVALLAMLAGLTCQSAKRPSVPVVIGPSTGVAGMPLTFRATSEDPNGDSVAFMFDWGDTASQVWTSLVLSGETISAPHTYADSGNYAVKARAKNDGGAESDWSGTFALPVHGRGAGYPDSLVGAAWLPRTWMRSIALSPDGRKLYATSGESLVYVMRTTDFVVTDSVSVGYLPWVVRPSPDGEYVYVLVQGDDSLVVLRSSDLGVISKVGVGPRSWDAGVTPDGALVYVTSADNDSVLVIRTSDRVIVARIRANISPAGLAIAPDGHTVYVACGDVLDAIDVASNTISSRIPLPAGGICVAVSPDGSAAYVGCGGGTIAVVSTTADTVLATFACSNSPSGITITPDGQYAVVCNDESPGPPVFRLDYNLKVGLMNCGWPVYAAAISSDGGVAFVSVIMEGIFVFTRSHSL